MLGKYSEAIRGNLTKIERLKLVALVTIEVFGVGVWCGCVGVTCGVCGVHAYACMLHE